MKDHLLRHSGLESTGIYHPGTLRYKAEVVFGNPKDACKGIGICHMIVGDTRLPVLQCNFGERIRCTTALRENSWLMVSFERSVLTPELEKVYFRPSGFYNPRLFVLNHYPGLSRGQGSLHLHAGFHPFAKDEQALHVYFRLG